MATRKCLVCRDHGHRHTNFANWVAVQRGTRDIQSISNNFANRNGKLSCKTSAVPQRGSKPNGGAQSAYAGCTETRRRAKALRERSVSLKSTLISGARSTASVLACSGQARSATQHATSGGGKRAHARITFSTASSNLSFGSVIGARTRTLRLERATLAL